MVLVGAVMEAPPSSTQLLSYIGFWKHIVSTSYRQSNTASGTGELDIQYSNVNAYACRDCRAETSIGKVAKIVPNNVAIPPKAIPNPFPVSAGMSIKVMELKEWNREVKIVKVI